MTPAQCRAARAQLRLSRTDLAAAARVRKSAICGFERGTHVLSAPSLAALHAALAAAGAATGAALIAEAPFDRALAEARGEAGPQAS